MLLANEIIMWVIIAVVLFLVFLVSMILLIIISKKTHALIEFKSSFKGTPISVFFQDNKYCEWKNTQPDAGMIEDKEYGSFVIGSTYIDKHTKNVLIPFNSSFAISLNVKSAKLADDLLYLLKEQRERIRFKESVMRGMIPETDGVKTLRTSVDFSALKTFVSPILPHSVRSKIVNTVFLRLKTTGNKNFTNIILLAIAAIGAIVLGGLVMKFAVFNKE